MSDVLLNLIGKLQRDTITTIFGPPGSGKSTICFELITKVVKSKKKVIYIDTEGGFSPERIHQIEPSIDLENIIVFSPKTFEEQEKVIKNLNKEIKNSKHIGLVIVDSLVMLYRLNLADSPQEINALLAKQLMLLTEISRTFQIPIFITNQMYVNFDTKERKMVGGTLVEYWSKTILEIDKNNDTKKLILKKHKFEKEGKEQIFEIHQQGLIPVKTRSFGFFKN